MKWVLIIAGVLIALVVLVFIVGLLSPKDHVATVSDVMPHPDSAIWAVVSDAERVPSWFSEVRSVTRVADVDGQPAYRENYGGFEVTNVVRERVPNRKLVREILPGGSFSGSWTLELAPEGGGTRVTITERGHVENAFFRAMMRFNDNKKTMRGYLDALGRKLAGG